MVGFRRASIAVLAVSLIGCSAPSVEFERATPQATLNIADVAAKAQDGAIVINLPISRILVAASASSNNNSTGAQNDSKPEASAPAASAVTVTLKSASGKDYAISVLPTESTRVYRVIGVNDFWSSNALGVTKLVNTDIPTVVANAFTDLTKSRIAAVGGIITSGMSVAKLVSASEANTTDCSKATLPSFAIDATSEDSDVFKNETNQIDTCWFYQLRPDPDSSSANPDPDHYKHSADSIRRNDFESNFVTGQKIGIWPVPSCMDVTLKVFKQGQSGSSELVTKLRIIDPDYVRLLAVPNKGSISMHPVCDANFSDTPVDKWGDGLDDISALEAQAAAIAKH
jgi:hypothetical protein